MARGRADDARPLRSMEAALFIAYPDCLFRVRNDAGTGAVRMLCGGDDLLASRWRSMAAMYATARCRAVDGIAKVRTKTRTSLRRSELIRDAHGAALRVVRQ